MSSSGRPGGGGAQGPQGTPGATGPQGPQGLTGNTGAAGTPGAGGSTGLTGSAGPAGTNGTPAAYTITDGVISTASPAAIISSASVPFTSFNVGMIVTDPNGAIGNNTTIVSVSAGAATLSSAATGTGNGKTLTIGPPIPQNQVPGLLDTLATFPSLRDVECVTGTFAVDNNVDLASSGAFHTEMGTSLGAGTWRVRGELYILSSATGATQQVRAGLIFPSGTKGPCRIDGPNTAATSSAALTGQTNNTGLGPGAFGGRNTGFLAAAGVSGQTIFGATFGGFNNGAYTFCELSGRLVLAAAGTVGVVLCQAVAATGAPVTLQQGSFVEYTKIA